MRLNEHLKGIAAMSLMTIAALIISCNKPVETQISLSVVKKDLSAKEGQQFVQINSNVSWTLSSDASWISFSETTGSGNASVVMSWESNDTEQLRSCIITLSGGGVRRAELLSQEANASVGPPTLKSDPYTNWMELPALSNRQTAYFITHRMKQGKYDSRNYSCYYDTEHLLSYWVAYPLNDALIGSGGRTDQWGYDPKIPKQYQPELFSGFRGANGKRYDRGHQLPSADRLTKEYNISTFYSTNMTPQLAALNQEIWADLEGRVRVWSKRFDTLYVVTGADINGSKDIAYDNLGKEVTVPVGYFKALLGYKSSGNVGASATMGGYTAIGFYFEHKAYSSVMPQSMTISELEKKTGWDFFVNLEEKIGNEKYTKVETYVDPWWQSN